MLQGVIMFWRNAHRRPKEYKVTYYFSTGNSCSVPTTEESLKEISKKIEEDGMTFEIPFNNSWVNLRLVTLMEWKEIE